MQNQQKQKIEKESRITVPSVKIQLNEKTEQNGDTQKLHQIKKCWTKQLIYGSRKGNKLNRRLKEIEKYNKNNNMKSFFFVIIKKTKCKPTVGGRDLVETSEHCWKYIKQYKEKAITSFQELLSCCNMKDMIYNSRYTSWQQTYQIRRKMPQEHVKKQWYHSKTGYKNDGLGI